MIKRGGASNKALARFFRRERVPEGRERDGEKIVCVDNCLQLKSLPRKKLLDTALSIC